MTKKEILISDISKIRKGIQSPTLEEKFKASLTEVLKQKLKELEDITDEESASKKSSATKKAPDTKKASAPAPAKKEESGKKSAKDVLENCREILRKHNKEKASAKKRIEKRKKQGKPATLTPSETVSKTAKQVEAKVVDMKDKGLSSGEVDKLANGIVATIKSTLHGIKNNTEKHEFLTHIKTEIGKLDGSLMKVAMSGGLFADGGVVMSYEEFKKLPINYDDKRHYPFGMMYRPYIKKDGKVIAGFDAHEVDTQEKNNDSEYTYKSLYNKYLLSNENKYADGGALNLLADTSGAGLQSVGGTTFSSADLTSHLDMNANPMFKRGGYMAKGGITKSEVELYIAREHYIHPNSFSVNKENGNWVIYPNNLEQWEADYGNKALDEIEKDVNKKFSDGGYMAEGGLAEYYEKKKYKYDEGGFVDENTEMLMSQVKEIRHHADEIQNLIDNNTRVEAWVVAKAERSATDLSDITHYIDGKKENFADGGVIKWQDVNVGDSANVKAENKTGVIIQAYGRKFHLKFVDGSEKTYDASELEFFKDDEGELFAGGGMVKTSDVRKELQKLGYSEEDSETLVEKYRKFVEDSKSAYSVAKEIDNYESDKSSKYEYAKGGRFNTGGAWTLDHYQHNKGENYEVPSGDRKYADGGSVNKNLFIGDILEFDGKKYQAVIGSNGWVNFKDLATKTLITPINTFWEVLYNEGLVVKSFKDIFAQGGLNEHGLEVGDKIIGESEFNENAIQVMNDGKWSLVDLDKGERMEGVYAKGGKIKKGDIYNMNGKAVIVFDSDGKNVVYSNVIWKDANEGMGISGESFMNKKTESKSEFLSKAKYVDDADLMRWGTIDRWKHFVSTGRYADGGETDDNKKELKNILSKDYETFIKLLGENIKDPKFRHTVVELAKDNKIKYKVIDVECLKLKPTQNEISLNKSLGLPLKSVSDAEKYLNPKEPIKIAGNTLLTCDNGNYIIDGHHRWSQVFVLNPKAKMVCTDFYQLKKPFEGLKATQLGISADLGFVPIKRVEEANILDISEKDLKKYVTENITPEVREVFKKNGINNPEEHIWKNVVLLKTTNKPVKGASKRDYMPQTDMAKDFEKYTPNVSKLKKGGKTTFNDKVKAIKEKLLKNKKVSPSVQKDYGKTYDKKEALESAKRIAGSIRAKEMNKKKN